MTRHSRVLRKAAAIHLVLTVVIAAGLLVLLCPTVSARIGPMKRAAGALVFIWFEMYVDHFRRAHRGTSVLPVNPWVVFFAFLSSVQSVCLSTPVCDYGFPYRSGHILQASTCPTARAVRYDAVYHEVMSEIGGWWEPGSLYFKVSFQWTGKRERLVERLPQSCLAGSWTPVLARTGRGEGHGRRRRNWLLDSSITRDRSEARGKRNFQDQGTISSGTR